MDIEAWIISKPAPSATSSGPASEISSLVSGDDLSERLLVSTTSPLAQQDLVVQDQNGVNMASSTATTVPARPLTAGPSTPSTIEPIVPIVVPLGAQDTSSVTGTSPIPIQTARLVVSTEQRTMQSTALPYTALPDPAMPYSSPAMPYSAMPSVMSARPYPMGYYGQGNQFPLMPNPNWMSEREQMLQHQLLQERSSLKLGELAKPSLSLSPPSGLPIKVEDDVEIISVRSASVKRPRPKDQATDKAPKCQVCFNISQIPLSQKGLP